MLLTDEQRNAIAEPGHVCLVSCPGSGKTRVIVAKLLYCLESVKDSTRRVACITHTNAAADEIDSRLRELCFGDEDSYYEVSTIHGFALQNVLRPFHELLPEFRHDFKIITSESEVYSEKAKELIRRYHVGVFALDEVERIERRPDGTPSPLLSLPTDLQREWCSWLDENGYVTLSEIVYHSGRLVSSYAHIASALASRFAWILVDEFQDSSPGQILILKEIHKFARTTFFCVGDPNQSIYRFAGASPELLIEFSDHVHAYRGHRLTGNFRSSERICVHAERLCASDPRMHAVGEDADCQISPVHRTVASPIAGIFDHFLPAVRELNIPLGEVAILAPWWLALFHLARELRRQNIPAVGPGARPYKRSHLVAHLIEPIGAYLESPEAAIAIAVQRSLFFLIANLTGYAFHSIFEYRGRVVVCKLLAEAAAARQVSGYAIAWVTDAAARFSKVLVEAELLPPDAGAELKRSAAEMVADIQGREGGNMLTVEDLGIFARPRNCVHLLTVHKAKGREFEAVAVIDAHDGRIPHFSVSKLTDRAEREAQYHESRRVVYVATTRAKRLLMFFSDTTDYRNRPTPFLAEMGL
jgi:DNA helicase-2/ATP-dependent DNA helicase PcrA